MTGDLASAYAHAAGQAIVETVLIVAAIAVLVYGLILGFVHLDRPIRWPSTRRRRREI